MSTRAQIGIYTDRELTTRPDALLYQHNDGYPTGSGGLVGKLIELGGSIIKTRGCFDAPYFAAQLLYHLIGQYDRGESGLGFAIDNVLLSDIRFYYAVTEYGIYVFDAREMTDGHLNNLWARKYMFFTAWKHDEELRAIDKEIRETTEKLSKLTLQKESIKRR